MQTKLEPRHSDAEISVGPKVRVGPRELSQPQTQIHVHKDGDRIEALTITCSCGEQITVQCNYND